MRPFFIGLAIAIPAVYHSFQSSDSTTFQEYESIFNQPPFPDFPSLIGSTEIVFPYSVNSRTIDNVTFTSTIDDEYTFSLTNVNNVDSITKNIKDTHFIFLTESGLIGEEDSTSTELVEIKPEAEPLGKESELIGEEDSTGSGLIGLRSILESLDKSPKAIREEDSTDIDLIELRSVLKSLDRAISITTELIKLHLEFETADREAELIREEDSIDIKITEPILEPESLGQEPERNIYEYEFAESNTNEYEVSDSDDESDIEIFGIDEESNDVVDKN